MTELVSSDASPPDADADTAGAGPAMALPKGRRRFETAAAAAAERRATPRLLLRAPQPLPPATALSVSSWRPSCSVSPVTSRASLARSVAAASCCCACWLLSTAMALQHGAAAASRLPMGSGTAVLRCAAAPRGPMPASVRIAASALIVSPGPPVKKLIGSDPGVNTAAGGSPHGADGTAACWNFSCSSASAAAWLLAMVDAGGRMGAAPTLPTQNTGCRMLSGSGVPPLPALQLPPTQPPKPLPPVLGLPMLPLLLSGFCCNSCLSSGCTGTGTGIDVARGGRPLPSA
mmetsp:Transcript_6834/g.21023  ORF Transcript_6834/g.21023 Transcript_6834/m.21023 type:complete len:289 (-) Transcript_6834:107-973(-)|eukprot:364323-Chlamydomonas_euryale.AAC.7